jgi:hypothetical protein
MKSASVRTMHIKPTKAKISNIRGRQKAHGRTVPGQVIAIGADSLTIVRGDRTYTVFTSAATVINRKKEVITLADVKVGDRVRVRGIVTGTSVSAQSIRDISLPIVSATPGI